VLEAASANLRRSHSSDVGPTRTAHPRGGSPDKGAGNGSQHQTDSHIEDWFAEEHVGQAAGSARDSACDHACEGTRCDAPRTFAGPIAGQGESADWQQQRGPEQGRFGKPGQRRGKREDGENSHTDRQPNPDTDSFHEDGWPHRSHADFVQQSGRTLANFSGTKRILRPTIRIQADRDGPRRNGYFAAVNRKVAGSSPASGASFLC
jgi:hypothetical protein